MKPYWTDLRMRVVQAYEHREGAMRQLVTSFRVSLSFVRRLLKHYRETGGVAPKHHGGGAPAKVDLSGREVVQALVLAAPDATLRELCQQFEEQCQRRISMATMSRVLAHLQLTRKKNVSREGVQRDLLPIIEGSTVNTKYGMVRTDHILFIAAGAFHVSKPSDLIPELQGRFPIRVELYPLGRDDFVRILKEPQNALIKQYKALLETEGMLVTFGDDAIDEIASIAVAVNERTENIGARRLHTVMERLLDEVSFEASDLSGQQIIIDAQYVRDKLADIIKDEDLTRYIL